MRWKKLRDKDGSDKVKNIVDRNSFKDTPYMRWVRFFPKVLQFQPFRYGHAVTPYKDKVYLWGGRNDQYGPGKLSSSISISFTSRFLSAYFTARLPI